MQKSYLSILKFLDVPKMKYAERSLQFFNGMSHFI
jgi:hypothetical protein